MISVVDLVWFVWRHAVRAIELRGANSRPTGRDAGYATTKLTMRPGT
jgi:hypothetical protein